MAKKETPVKPSTVCPVSREDFLASAKPVSANVGGVLMALGVKEFSTGSYGFYGNGKITLEVGGVPVVFQAAVNLTAVGSKPQE